ncbi:MAG: hypothetical protein JWO56_367 [Acidobacteria bacterium]|nr:hypothetical protein [Acidobacteriota bacterium]
MARNVERQKQSSKRKSSKSNTGIKASSRDTQSTAYITESKEPLTPRRQAAQTRKGTGNATTKPAKSKNPLKRAASALGRAVAKLTGRTKAAKAAEPMQQSTDHDRQPATRRKAAGQTAARAPRREADIPLDQLESTYTPTQTSLKAGFRASGADRQRDQEFATGTGRDRWNDEDQFTNKSGDPRIGTHNRTYEPGEGLAAARNNDLDLENE